MGKNKKNKKQTAKGKKQDKAIKALPEGKRVSEKTGDTYFESRSNRSDKDRRKKLASGGSLQSMTTEQLASKAGVTMEDMDTQNLHRDDLIAMITEGNYKRGGQTKSGKKQDAKIKALHAGKRESEDGNIYYEHRKNRSDVNRTKKLEEGGGTSSKSHEELVNGKLDSNGEISCADFEQIIQRSPCYPVCEVGASKYRKQFMRGCYRKI